MKGHSSGAATYCYFHSLVKGVPTVRDDFSREAVTSSLSSPYKNNGILRMFDSEDSKALDMVSSLFELLFNQVTGEERDFPLIMRVHAQVFKPEHRLRREHGNEIQSNGFLRGVRMVF